MIKTVVTLLRGKAFEAEERLADRHALALLDQQMRDAALSADRAKKALAIAMAQDKAEARKLEAARARRSPSWKCGRSPPCGPAARI